MSRFDDSMCLSPADILDNFSSQNNFEARRQFLQVAQSNALQPTMLGFLTGSTEDMTTSPAFLTIFEKIFNIDNVGLKWSTVNINSNPPKNQS